MANEKIIIELHFDGAWHSAAELEIFDAAGGANRATRLGYIDDYISESSNYGAKNERAVSARFPVEFDVWSCDDWPAFLFDSMPAGAARRWWERRLADRKLTERQLEFELLRDHTIAPIGNMRVRSVQPETDLYPFTKDEVCRRDSGFLEYAAEAGAAIGGATGAGGDAPKVLLAEDAEGKVYADGVLPDEEVVASWLVKWPRGRDTNRDRLILRTEHLYALALAELGFDIKPGEWRHIEDTKPSLWLPRFDRIPVEGGLQRLAVESLYSLAGVVEPGATIPHQRFLEALANALPEDQAGDLPGIIKEYVCRDLLDIVLGNSDNHGRNRAVIRNQPFRLAPIYDLAPMVMDYEGITRSSRWSGQERGGQIDWSGVCGGLAPWVEAEELKSHLREFGQRLLALPDLLNELGLDDEVMNFSRIHLSSLPETLSEWGLQ